MPDVVDRQTRSRMMSGIRGKDTKPEMVIRKGLHRLGYRFRLHRKDLPGKPDICLPASRGAIFVNGCFWHGHDCHLFKMPKTRTEFWAAKISSNQARDEANTISLLDAGWRVLHVWECALKGRLSMPHNEVLAQISDWICSDRLSETIRGTG